MRERLLEEMLRAVAARGYDEVTVAEVVRAAGVPREVFDRLFTGKEECFLAAYDAAVDVLLRAVTTSYERSAGAPWPERVLAALRTLVELLSAEAEIARMAIVEVNAVGVEARSRYRIALGRFLPLLEEGRDYAPRGDELPAGTARFAIGGATSLLFDEVRAGRGAELERALPQLSFAVLMPYLGAEAAEVEMERVAGGS